jgi:hypothetical protein
VEQCLNALLSQQFDEKRIADVCLNKIKPIHILRGGLVVNPDDVNILLFQQTRRRAIAPKARYTCDQYYSFSFHIQWTLLGGK